jgi:hypothetical protein
MGWAVYLAPDAAGFVFSNDFMAVGLGLGTASDGHRAPGPSDGFTPGDGG